MTEPKTIRVRRLNPREELRFSNDSEQLTVYVTYEYAHANELDITITVPKSREERLRKARLDALLHCYSFSDMRKILEIMERIDAEFAKGEGDGG